MGGVRQKMQRSKSYFSSGQCKSSLSLLDLEGGAGPWSSGAVNYEVLFPGLATRWRGNSH